MGDRFAARRGLRDLSGRPGLGYVRGLGSGRPGFGSSAFVNAATAMKAEMPRVLSFVFIG